MNISETHKCFGVNLESIILGTDDLREIAVVGVASVNESLGRHEDWGEVPHAV